MKKAGLLVPVVLGFMVLTMFLFCFQAFVFSETLHVEKGAVIDQQKKGTANPYAQARIAVRIIPSLQDTFGYEILVNGKVLIRQPHIPALPGRKGFATKKEARRVADFVAEKIRKNEMPPTVTAEDLERMGILQKGTLR